MDVDEEHVQIEQGVFTGEKTKRIASAAGVSSGTAGPYRVRFAHMVNICHGPLLWNSVPEDFETRTRRIDLSVHCAYSKKRGVRKKKKKESRQRAATARGGSGKKIRGKRGTAINSVGEVRKSAGRNRRGPAVSSCEFFFSRCRLLAAVVPTQRSHARIILSSAGLPRLCIRGGDNPTSARAPEDGEEGRLFSSRDLHPLPGCRVSAAASPRLSSASSSYSG